MIMDEKSIALNYLYEALVKIEMISNENDLEEMKRHILFDGSLRKLNQELENGIIKHLDKCISEWRTYHATKHG